MSKITKFEDIVAWQCAKELNKAIYEITSRGGFTKDSALRDQIRRASISVSSNIAEGYERNGRKEFIHFLSIAKASAGEVRSQLALALDLGYVTALEYRGLRDQAVVTSKLIWGMMEYLRQCGIEGNKFRKE